MSIREIMTTDIAKQIESQIGQSMPEEVWTAIANMWSQDRLREAYPDENVQESTNLKCKICTRNHKCRWAGTKGHNP